MFKLFHHREESNYRRILSGIGITMSGIFLLTLLLWFTIGIIFSGNTYLYRGNIYHSTNETGEDLYYLWSWDDDDLGKRKIFNNQGEPGFCHEIGDNDNFVFAEETLFGDKELLCKKGYQLPDYHSDRDKISGITIEEMDIGEGTTLRKSEITDKKQINKFLDCIIEAEAEHKNYSSKDDRFEGEETRYYRVGIHYADIPIYQSVIDFELDNNEWYVSIAGMDDTTYYSECVTKYMRRMKELYL
ncbi:MAG: hypothetical protein K6G65_02435 [Lachnospiraceae bacterium]|nr:hypothetical protein [Lachnospiraceae bacterium]